MVTTIGLKYQLDQTFDKVFCLFAQKHCKTIIILFILMHSFNKQGYTQIKADNLGRSDLPKSIPFQGDFYKGYKWKDRTGNHLLILSNSYHPWNEKESDEAVDEGDLYVAHFQENGSDLSRTWRIHDYVRNCPVDMFLYFIDQGIAITDLDKNGKAEVWIMYKVSCQGDVSPVTMKIIMYEDGQKFAVRGSTRVRLSENNYEGGEYTFDTAFKNGPSVFREYAKGLWKKQVTENWKKKP